MKVNYKKAEGISFCILARGNAFLWSNMVFMKTEKWAHGNASGNAVKLENGSLHRFSDEEKVIPVDAEVNMKVKDVS